MNDSLLADALEELLVGRCTPQRVRQIEAQPDGDAARSLWTELEESGFVDALVAESSGGAGLGLGEAALVALACGRHAMPLPVVMTLAARAALAPAGAMPRGAIAIAQSAAPSLDGAVSCGAVPYGLAADWVLICAPSGDWLLPTGAAVRQRSGGQGSLAADLHWATVPRDAVRAGTALGMVHWRATAAAFIAAQMAGAMQRLLEMTIAYANDRVQFGKPIGKLQVIQQQVSVMAEQAFAARTAALIGLAGAGTRVQPLRAAIAKARTGEAAIATAAVSHAVHGAIGVTEEFDLQLHTRRLHEWRGQYGGETYWQRRLGSALVETNAPPLEFVQKVAGAAVAG